MNIKQHFTCLKNIIVGGSCTMAPDFNFKTCCKIHDEDYRTGIMSRLSADKELARCIFKRGWWVFFPVPVVYFIAVRLFGGRFYKG